MVSIQTWSATDRLAAEFGRAEAAARIAMVAEEVETRIARRASFGRYAPLVLSTALAAMAGAWLLT